MEFIRFRAGDSSWKETPRLGGFEGTFQRYAPNTQYLLYKWKKGPKHTVVL